MTRTLITSILFLTSFLVFAQQSITPTRKGIAFGIALGVANSQLTFPTTKQQNTDLAINWKVGYMINPNLAVLLDGAVSIYEYNLSGRPRKRDFGGLFPSVQYHLTDKFWVLAGLGIGTDAPVFYDLKPEHEEELQYYTGFGCLTSIGYEIFKRNNFVIDIQARFNYSSVNLPIGKTNGFNSGILLGINFY